MKKPDEKESRLAVLVDCDNVVPEIMAYAMPIADGLGRSVIRRGYGNSGSLTHKWQSILVNLAFTPRLQYPYAAGKNTSDIALSLDALEIWFERRADTVCIISSDSDFTYLCRKLREYGAQVYVIGQAQTPVALRNACDQFFEWTRTIPAQTASAKEKITSNAASVAHQASQPASKQSLAFLLTAVNQLLSDTPHGKVSLGALGRYIKQHHPECTPKKYGHANLLKMLKSVNSLKLHQENNGWYVSLS